MNTSQGAIIPVTSPNYNVKKLYCHLDLQWNWFFSIKVKFKDSKKMIWFYINYRILGESCNILSR